MTDKPWISTISLPAEVVEKFIEQFLRDPADFEFIEVNHLTAKPLEIPVGLASRVLGLARRQLATIVPDEEELQIDRALEMLGGPKHDRALIACRRLYVQYIILDDNDKIDIKKTREYLAEGQPNANIYDGGIVVGIEEVGAKRKHHPKTGERLTKADPIGFHALDRETLIVARAIFASPSVLAGESDRAVLVDIEKNGPMTAQAKILLRRRDFAESCARWIDGENYPAQVTPVRGEKPPSTINPYKQLADLFIQLFSSDELRRFVRFQIGSEYERQLPAAQTSLTQFTFDLVEILRRYGLITISLRNSLRAERPRLAAEIDGVFMGFGL